MIPRRLRALCMLAALTLLLAGCAPRVQKTADLTEIQAFLRESLVTLLNHQGIDQYEILGSTLSVSGGRYRSSYDLEIGVTEGKSTYQSLDLVVELTDDGGIMLVEQPTLPDFQT